jgi:hypothetical protein
MGSPQDVGKDAKRSAEILFALTLFLAGAVYLLNLSLADRRRLVNRHRHETEMYSQMIERLRSFRARDAALFSRLAMASFSWIELLTEDTRRYPTLVRMVPLRGQGYTFLPIPEDRLVQLAEGSRAFGDRAASVFAVHSSPDDRARELAEVVLETFNRDREAALFLNSEIVPHLAHLDMPSEWDRIAWWIAYDKWPEPPGGHNQSPGEITFATRINEWPSEYDRRFQAYQLLLFLPPGSTPEHELFRVWNESRSTTQPADLAPPRVTVPMVGLSVPTETIVAAAGPLLALLQLIFLVHWAQRRPVALSRRATFEFPSYACPRDPFEPPRPRTLADLVQRFVWVLFLVLPGALLTVGLLTRYDLTFPLLYFEGGRGPMLFAVEEWARADDVLSALIDSLTFASLVASSLAVFAITGPTLRTTHRYRRMAQIAAVVVAALLSTACVVVTLIEFRVATHGGEASIPFRMHYLVGFGIFASIWLSIAFYHRAKFIAVLATIGLTIFALHFVSL